MLKNIGRVRACVLFLMANSVPAVAQKGASPARASQASSRVLVSVHDTAAHLFTAYESGLRDSLRQVIRDSATFAALWNRVAETDSMRAHSPTIDFAKFDVIVVSLGALGVWGPRIHVDTVAITGSERRIVVRRFFPPSPCDSEGSYGSAVDMVVVPRTGERSTRFVVKDVHTNHCPSARDPATKP